MTAILGLSAFYHDSAAALVVDGEIVAAAQEERFSRNKHDASFPKQAAAYCLRQAGIGAEDLDYVAFYEKPVTKFHRLLETYLAFAPRGYRSFRQAIPAWIGQKLHLPRVIRAGLDGRYTGRIVFTEHHESHAASAFFPSPFSAAAILTMDGVGEWSTACLGVGRGNTIQLQQEIRFPHSLGLLYSAFTYYCGFRVNSGEYKLMGLAPYGQPVYRQAILDHLLDLKEDGSLRLDMSYFRYCQGLTMTGSKFHQLFGGPPRQPESKLTRREMDLAASVQAVTEEIVLRTAAHVQRVTGMENLVLAGGVALNCVANGRLLREGPFAEIWIQPAAGDAGGALGAALFVWHQLLERPRRTSPADSLHGSFLGPEYTNDEVQAVLTGLDAAHDRIDSDEELCDRVAELLASGLVVGWFQGRMEFGPRALGARSILGDARSDKMQRVMNQKIKFRESFRPFAPIVLREKVDEYFEMGPAQESPYMQFVAPLNPSVRCALGAEYDAADGLDKLGFRRSQIPAVTHVDFSARLQTVDPQRHPLLHQLLTRFHGRTACAVLINTSFNVRGEPIVCTPEDAYRCFMMTDIDVLVLGRYVLLKSEQHRHVGAAEQREHLEQFQLD